MAQTNDFRVNDSIESIHDLFDRCSFSINKRFDLAKAWSVMLKIFRGFWHDHYVGQQNKQWNV